MGAIETHARLLTGKPRHGDGQLGAGRTVDVLHDQSNAGAVRYLRQRLEAATPWAKASGQVASGSCR